MKPDNKYRGFYRLRNGLIVEAYHPDNEWTPAPVTLVETPATITPISELDAFKKRGGHNNLYRNGSDDPMQWTGGAWKEGYDVVERLQDYKVTIVN